MATHAFSVDLEDWFHGIELPPASWPGKEERLREGLDVLLGLLDDAGVRATFFTMGYIADRHPDVVRALADAGHEIGSHGRLHEKLYEMGPGAFRREEAATKSLLEDITGQAVRGHRAPFFSITAASAWALDVLGDLGYAYDCSISPAATWRYGMPAAPEGIYRVGDQGLVEFTTSTWKVLGRRFGVGGAWFRIFPYLLTQRPFEAGDAAGRPAMFYVHPWEYDPGHPVVTMPWRPGFTHYRNLRATFGRTRRLLADYRFGTVWSAIENARKAGPLPTVSVEGLRGDSG